MPRESQSKHSLHVEEGDNGVHLEDDGGGDALISAQNDGKMLEATWKVFGGSTLRGVCVRGCN